MAGQVGAAPSDANGLSLMLRDSQAAANNYGLKGSRFGNVPKNKFLFGMKFFRAGGMGGTTSTNGLSLPLKNIDRPAVTFKTETLNQYNRKRVVQTGHEFEPLRVRFHDTTDPALLSMFVEYYQFYYGDSKIYGAGSSGSTVYDVVTGEGYETGKWGFLPPLAEQNYGYFFSHISIYQFYGGMVERFDIINPKIQNYNPDDFDYSVGGVTNEVQMAFEFEGIVYAQPERLDDNDDLVRDFGLDRGQFWDVKESLPTGLDPGVAIQPNAITSDPIEVVGNVLRRNIFSAVTGQGANSLGGMIAEAAGAYDANRSLAVGKTALKSLKNIVSGNRNAGIQGGQGLLKGVLSGSPGKGPF